MFERHPYVEWWDPLATASGSELCGSARVRVAKGKCLSGMLTLSRGIHWLPQMVLWVEWLRSG
jgi:hypothetical protein